MTLVLKWFNTYQILSHPRPIYIGFRVEGPLNVVCIGFVAIKLQIGHVIIIDAILHVLKTSQNFTFNKSSYNTRKQVKLFFSFGLCIHITII
jgi:hypothetical protein